MTNPCVCALQSASKLSTSANLTVASLRVNYSNQGLDETQLTPDPIALFSTWFDQARSAQEHEPNAMCLSTADESGRPSARMVLLKAFDQRGFVWYTNYQSRKASNLSRNPFASLTFWWPTMERSVRIEGPVVRVPVEESDAYFHSRPPSSRLGAIVSDQSKEIKNRQLLELRWQELQDAHLDDDGQLTRPIERPSHWGGYRLIPDRIEFWKGRSARLHDRIVYQRDLPELSDHNLDQLAKLQWATKRLQP
ncbi:Pyridoxine/pyridoxamine 5'-phosphate oxidase [Gracilariopsis chorda]|uniref:pyridoxal 5'-phosphate synthase n=1 Tax=Gracilariopsis chorda TaxID=448386 RepID=A0A2V3ICY3_9FLOR|nr:Pyridoxine/pyridoxamine 5'-phosphate oxidase [Gracilariopsis chorda]|eukprot:PXF39946.1 Pyridoxine/pyridoxamine 5'-phosphate oxidase [Gracilariopsis chorda]